MSEPSKIAADVKKNILVIGAYGLIGEGIARHLVKCGHAVTGLGRDLKVAKSVLPWLPWIERDLRHLTRARDWFDLVAGFELVVNCSGALQDGGADDLEAVHVKAVAALAEACAVKDVQLIQISSVGACEKASTEFLSTKGKGDAAIRSLTDRYQIFRPGLVLAKNAYGGTSLLRLLAAFPVVQPMALPEAKVQTVALDDICQVVNQAVSGRIPVGFEGDLVEADAQELKNILFGFREWLGFRRTNVALTTPAWFVKVTSKVADGLAQLGWRSPLRTTAITVLQNGVVGNPRSYAELGLGHLSSFEETLNGIPVGAQDRLQARMALLMPIVIATLSLFWLISGVVGIVKIESAAEVLQLVGWPKWLAMMSVAFWACIDLLIGSGFAIRKYAKTACWAAVGVSLFYLFASSIVTPHLWGDPLGPLVKVIPGMVLAVIARVLLETR